MSEQLKLKIEAKKSILDGLVCYDVFNTEILDKIINSTLKEDTEEWNESNQLDKIRNRLRKDMLKVIYKRSKSMSYGRVNPEGNLSLSMLRRQLRHSVCKWKVKEVYEEYYYDIDIENCHYVIIQQLCKANNQKCDKITKYVNNRDEILKMIMEEWKIERAQAKQLFILIIYGGSIDKFVNKLELEMTMSVKEIYEISRIGKSYKFLSKLKLELDAIQKIVIDMNPDIKYEVERNKILKEQTNYNADSSTFSYFVQEYECRILECMYLYCKANKYILNNIVSLCSDGFALPRANVKDLDNLIKELERVVKEVTGFKIKLVNKPMDEDLLKELDDAQLNQEEHPNSYNNIKEEFEKTHFKLLNPILYVTEYEDDLIRKTKTEFLQTYENKYYITTEKTEKGNTEKKKKFVNDWISDEKIRTYEKVDFLPKIDVSDNVYNTFRGFQVDKLESNNELDVKESLIYKHLLNLCGCDEKVFEYVLMMLSKKVKKPSEVTGTSLIIKSIPGCGKDTFFDWFGNNILGNKYYFNNVNPDLLFGHFNAQLANKFLCVLNETSHNGTKDIIEQLKGNITASEITINEKGVKPYKIKNFATFILLTNNDNPIKIDPADRRYLAFECNNDIANDEDYFRNLRKEIESKKYDKVFYDYLLTLDSENYNFVKNRPETQFNKDLKEISVPLHGKFLEDLLFKKIDTRAEHKRYILNVEQISASKMYQYYSDYIIENNIKLEFSKTLFGLQLRSYKTIIKKRTSKGNSYEINYKKLEDELVKMKYIEPIPDNNE
jgi:hypothetical protein